LNAFGDNLANVLTIIQRERQWYPNIKQAGKNPVRPGQWLIID
jgi:hypothetical protein